MKSLLLLATGLVLSVASPTYAEGDAAAGEKEFKRCKSCHTIKNGDEVLIKGGKAGPNLYGVVGRAAGSEDFKYSKSMLAAGEGGLIWDEANIAVYITDPKAFLRDFTGDAKAKSKMTFKAKKNQEDLAAYLASDSPVIEEEATEANDS